MALERITTRHLSYKDVVFIVCVLMIIGLSFILSGYLPLTGIHDVRFGKLG